MTRDQIIATSSSTSSRLRKAADRVRYARAVAEVVAGPRGAAEAFSTHRASREPDRSGEFAAPMPVHMKALAGGPIWVRPGTTDLSNATAYFREGIHLPPPEIAAGSLSRICELGSNMGAALAALGVAYPQAQLLGVEPDVENLRVAKANIELFGDRAEIVGAAIWDRDDQLAVERNEVGSHGITIGSAAPGGSTATIPGLTIDQLLERHVPGREEIDYMHVTIEGSEPRVFAAGGLWPQRVRSLRVEVHPYFGYSIDDCRRQLNELGYRTWPCPTPPDKWVFAIRT